MKEATTPTTRDSERRPVDVRTRFERFPASIKGAFVLQGSDGNPHAVQLASAWIARIPSGPRRAMPVEAEPVDVAPSRDLFIPFEMASSDLAPSWYAIESSVRVDGGRSYEFGSRPFVVPWPKGENRRGTTRVDRKVKMGRWVFFIDRLELAPDSASVVWRAERPENPSEDDPAAVAALAADGARLEVLPSSVGALRPELRVAPGERRTISYPVPRAARSVSVQLKLGARQQSDLIKVSFQ